MNILFDTNIIIQLEDIDKLRKNNYSSVKMYCNQFKYQMFIHPDQKSDFNNDKDIARKSDTFLRLEQYQILKSPPYPTKEDLSQLGWNESSKNDQIDNYLLYALYKNSVNILVTNDKDIIKKSARRIQLKEKVHTLDSFLFFLKSQLPKEFFLPSGIKSDYLYTFDKDQVFFNSLRDEYPDFNKWYDKCSIEHRKAWYIGDKNDILAICIFKIEENEIISNDSDRIFNKILKLCTFKVSESYRGRKIGERLLFTAFNFALDYKIEYIYIQIHGSEQAKLISLCIDYGFTYFGKYNNDDVYLKKMYSTENSNLTPLEYSKHFYPFFLDDPKIRKFIIPIQNNYHERLFPDDSNHSKSLFKNLPDSYGPEANSIKKAYICHSNVTKINEGDLLFFYRSKDRQSIQCMGIAEYITKSNDFNHALALVSKRTVYKKDQLSVILAKNSLIILFRYIKCKKEIKLSDLTSIGIKSPIQTIREISNEQYCKLFKE